MGDEGESDSQAQCIEELKAPENGGNENSSIFSPRFKSAAAMAGWDEETLLLASLVVDDTPDRKFKNRKRTDSQFKSPPTSSRRKRRAQRRSPISIPIAALDLDAAEESSVKEKEKKETETETDVNESKKKADLVEEKSGASCSTSSLPCMDKLREELSCAICLEICFEPSTTPCGHSFCKKCLRSAADKCGKKCPKCRQLISNGRSCTVNTVLWNTIQLLFPQEVEARKQAGSVNNQEVKKQISEQAFYSNLQHQNQNRERTRRGGIITIQVDDTQIVQVPERADVILPRRTTRGMISLSQVVEDIGLGQRRDSNTRSNRRRGLSSQDEDAALALRLQREEFMGALRVSTNEIIQTNASSSSSNSRAISLARENLRAMASRAINFRARHR